MYSFVLSRLFSLYKTHPPHPLNFESVERSTDILSTFLSHYETPPVRTHDPRVVKVTLLVVSVLYSTQESLPIYLEFKRYGPLRGNSSGTHTLEGCPIGYTITPPRVYGETSRVFFPPGVCLHRHQSPLSTSTH